MAEHVKTQSLFVPFTATEKLSKDPSVPPIHTSHRQWCRILVVQWSRSSQLRYLLYNGHDINNVQMLRSPVHMVPTNDKDGCCIDTVSNVCTCIKAHNINTPIRVSYCHKDCNVNNSGPTCCVNDRNINTPRMASCLVKNLNIYQHSHGCIYGNDCSSQFDSADHKITYQLLKASSQTSQWLIGSDRVWN